MPNLARTQAPLQYSTACSTLSTAKISNPSIFCFGFFGNGLEYEIVRGGSRALGGA